MWRFFRNSFSDIVTCHNLKSEYSSRQTRGEFKETEAHVKSPSEKTQRPTFNAARTRLNFEYNK